MNDHIATELYFRFNHLVRFRLVNEYRVLRSELGLGQDRTDLG
jgi:hypothetical protein